MENKDRDQAVEPFYVSWRWRRCRSAYANSKGNLCERCLARGIIEPGSKERPLEVHHKIPLTVENVNDPEISLNWNNLELLCKTCHEQERKRKPQRWTIGPGGRVTI
ncbi:MAG: HNH endonuclease [Lachnospiraceae bacterium]|nr:HNH endonuclease [Lachnospiraceae bacterium]